ncbi:MAG: ComEC/Rec2 family competence protein [Bacteroidia bacterium]
MFDVNKYPFVRILIPFCLGIYFSSLRLFSVDTFSSLLFLFGLFLVFTLLVIKRIHFWSICVLDIGLCLIGIILMSQSLKKQSNESNEFNFKGKKVSCLGQIVEVPIPKKSFTSLMIKPIYVQDSINMAFPVGTILVRDYSGSKSENFSPGEYIYFKSEIKKVQSPIAPLGFDFGQYYADKGIYANASINDKIFLVEGIHTDVSLRIIGQQIKQGLIGKLKKSSLTHDAFSIVSGLLTGYDEEINQSIKESFSHSGTMHILSVSGLHVGIIYLALNWLLTIVFGKERFKSLKLLIVFIVLLLFGLITGWHAPVVRSVLMFMVAGIGNIYFRNNSDNQINLLALTAFIMLLFNPLLIRDVGFILSYSSVSGIFLFYSRLESIYKGNSFVIKKIWQTASVSTSALIISTPFILLFFHQFPLFFIFSNLFIVPAATVLMFGGLISLFNVIDINFILNWLTGMMIKFISLFDSSSAFIDDIPFSHIDILFYLILLAAICIYITQRTYKSMFTSLAIIAIWLFSAFFSLHATYSRTEIVVFDSYKNPIIGTKSNGIFYVHRNDSVLNRSKSYLANRAFPKRIFFDYNFIRTNQSFVFHLTNPIKLPDSILGKITHLIVSNNAKLDEAAISKTNLRQLVLDGTSSRKSTNYWNNLTSLYGIPLYSTREKGIYLCNLE